MGTNYPSKPVKYQGQMTGVRSNFLSNPAIRNQVLEYQVGEDEVIVFFTLPVHKK